MNFHFSWTFQARNTRFFGHQEQFQPTFSKTVSEAIKGEIREALTQQTSLGDKLTIHGYMSIKWRTVLGPQSGENHGKRDQIKHLLKRLFPFYGDLPRERGGPERQTCFITEKRRYSAIRSERTIRQIYKLQSEICKRDRHIFNTDLDTMLQSRRNKKRRFLERPEYLIAESKKWQLLDNKQ